MNQDLFSVLVPEEHSVHLEILDKDVKIRPYTHGDTKAFLDLLEDYKTQKRGAIKKLFEAQRNLINKCIIGDSAGNRIDAELLNRADYVKLLVMLKNHTKGEKQSVSFQCVNRDCESANKQPHVESLEFKWEDVELKGKESEQTISFTVNGKNVVLHMYPYTFQLMLYNSELFEMDVPNFEAISRFQASFIEAIEIDEEMYDKLSMQDKIKFVNQLVPKYQMLISEYIDNQPMYTWEKTWQCPVCGAKNISRLANVTDFFF